MKNRMTYRIFFGIMALATILLSSCAEEELMQQNGDKSCVQIVGRVPGFTDYDVATRAAKTPEESAIKYMTLLIYDNAGRLINKQSIVSSVPLFVVDRNTLSQLTSNGIDQADMYMITNISEAEVDGWNILTVDDLMAVKHTYNVASLDIPANGFPMMGSLKDVNLNPGLVIPDSKIEIPLENLFAKIVFNIRLETVQEYNDPSFQMVSWEVHNLPKGFGLAGTGTGGQTSFYNDTFDSPVSSRRFTGANPVTGSNSLSFSFYMPEHKVNPAVEASDYSYPAGISVNEKQRFKPCLVDKECNQNIPDSYDGEPTYVVINGVFTDHQNHQYVVSYKVYLGSDNWQNFQVERNGQYNNSIVIRGITNSQSGEDGSVSIDHRVNVERDDILVHMERETLLDSHFEVRPIRVEMRNPGKVEVRLLGDCNWVRMEKKASAPSGDATYCTNGKRKYFTTSLMNDLSNDPIYVTSNSDNCVWVYIDENTETISGTVTDEKIKEQQKKTREAQIEVRFIPEGATDPTVVKTYTFEQRYLYPVKSRSRDGHVYYIEYFEEYLHNFDSDDNFGLTDYEGMAWGLDGLRLSHKYQAAFVNNTSSEGKNFFTWIAELFGWSQETFVNEIQNQSGEDVNYDFYLPRDNPSGGTTRAYSGYDYTKEIVEHVGVADKVLALSEQPASAVEYCYNKNRRTNAGVVGQVNWYMPSIDEIEDITMAAYTEFDVFQDKYYWSSQPAYLNYDLQVTGTVYAWFIPVTINTTGAYSSDDLSRARATKVSYAAGEYANEESGTIGFSGKNVGAVSGSTGNPSIKYTYSAYANPTITRGNGNKLRTEKCRVRAVYKP